MSPQSSNADRPLPERRAEALRFMRHAEWAAYLQGALSVGVYVLLGITSGDWVAPAYFAIIGPVLIVLGFRVGRRQSAIAAGVLLAIVLAGAVLQVVAGGRPPALIFVAIFAYAYGKAFTAARTYAALAVADRGASPAAT